MAKIVLTLAEALGALAIAEGIEEDADRQALLRLGYRLLQDLGPSRPEFVDKEGG